MAVVFTDKKSEWPSYWKGVTKRRVCHVPWSVASHLHGFWCYIGHVREDGERITPIWLRHHPDGNLYIYTGVVDMREQQAARLAAHSAMKGAIAFCMGIVGACGKIDTSASECKRKFSTLVQSVTLA